MFTNKYALLVIINIPILLIGIIGAITNYKTSRISKQRCALQVVLWLLIGAAFVSVEPIYNSLIRHHLTESAPMSIFDMVLLTGIAFCLLLIKQANERIMMLNKKLARLHESQAMATVKRGSDFNPESNK
jgi:hypothetical protein